MFLIKASHYSAAEKIAEVTGGNLLRGNLKKDGTYAKSTKVVVADFESIRGLVEAVTVVFDLFEGDGGEI